MLRFVTHDFENDDVVAVLRRDGEHLLIVMNAAVGDSARRCEAVNRLLEHLPRAVLAA